MELEGTLIRKLEQEAGQSKAGKPWVKQICLVDTGKKYNPIVAVTCFGEDKIKEMNKLKDGETVWISCNVYSSEYNGKYFNKIDGWRFAKHKQDGDDFVTSDDNIDMPF